MVSDSHSDSSSESYSESDVEIKQRATALAAYEENVRTFRTWYRQCRRRRRKSFLAAEIVLLKLQSQSLPALGLQLVPHTALDCRIEFNIDLGYLALPHPRGFIYRCASPEQHWAGKRVRFGSHMFWCDREADQAFYELSKHMRQDIALVACIGSKTIDLRERFHSAHSLQKHVFPAYPEKPYVELMAQNNIIVPMHRSEGKHMYCLLKKYCIKTCRQQEWKLVGGLHQGSSSSSTDTAVAAPGILHKFSLNELVVRHKLEHQSNDEEIRMLCYHFPDEALPKRLSEHLVLAMAFAIKERKIGVLFGWVGANPHILKQLGAIVPFMGTRPLCQHMKFPSRPLAVKDPTLNTNRTRGGNHTLMASKIMWAFIDCTCSQYRAADGEHDHATLEEFEYAATAAHELFRRVAATTVINNVQRCFCHECGEEFDATAGLGQLWEHLYPHSECLRAMGKKMSTALADPRGSMWGQIKSKAFFKSFIDAIEIPRWLQWPEHRVEAWRPVARTPNWYGKVISYGLQSMEHFYPHTHDETSRYQLQGHLSHFIHVGASVPSKRSKVRKETERMESRRERNRILQNSGF